MTVETIVGVFFAVLLSGAMLAVLGFGAWTAYKTTQPAIRPDDSKARAEEDAKVKAADKARDEQKRQPLAEWINGRFGKK